MRKLMKKKVSLLGKEVSVFAIVAIAMVTLVSAALLVSYGSITGLVIVNQSVLVDGEDYSHSISNSYDVTAGGSVSDCGHNVKNHAEIPAVISLNTTCAGNYETAEDDEEGICDGVTTDMYGVLNLTKKNLETWDAIEAPIEITYTIIGGEFKATGVPDGYTLIYYKDNDANANDVDRLTVLGDGVAVFESIPASNDWNAGPLADYCNNEIDEYNHCRGAKLWAVPTEDIDTTSNKLVWTHPDNYYFETDLVVYSTGDTITLPAGGGFDFCVDSEFAINLVPDTYTITTEIVPVIEE